MNLSPRWVDFFTAAGIEAAHWSALGSPKAPDCEIMAFAAEHDWIVITHDLDFSAILAATQGQKPSVVQLRAEDLRPEINGGLVLAAILQMSAELAEGALLSLDANRARMRLLPLSRT